MPTTRNLSSFSLTQNIKNWKIKMPMNWEIEAKTLPYSSSQYEGAQMQEEWPTFSPFQKWVTISAGTQRGIELGQKHSVKICTMEIDEQPEQYFSFFFFKLFKKWIDEALPATNQSCLSLTPFSQLFYVLCLCGGVGWGWIRWGGNVNSSCCGK